MATVYILYSESLEKFYVGSCKDLTERMDQHLNKVFDCSFTRVANDWEIFYQCDDLEYDVARQIEIHIKKMKSVNYYANLKRYPEIMIKLIAKYGAGSSR